MDDGIPKDMLYLASTRPAMKWGVPVEGLMINLGVSYLAFMVVGPPICSSVRGTGERVDLPDRTWRHADDDRISSHNMFRIVRLAAETRGHSIPRVFPFCGR